MERPKAFRRIKKNAVALVFQIHGRLFSFKSLSVIWGCACGGAGAARKFVMFDSNVRGRPACSPGTKELSLKHLTLF